MAGLPLPQNLRSRRRLLGTKVGRGHDEAGRLGSSCRHFPTLPPAQFREIQKRKIVGRHPGVSGRLFVADENGSHLGLFLSPLHSRMTRALRFGLRASGQGRAAPGTGAEGRLNAELAETILACVRDGGWTDLVLGSFVLGPSDPRFEV